MQHEKVFTHSFSRHSTGNGTVFCSAGIILSSPYCPKIRSTSRLAHHLNGTGLAKNKSNICRPTRAAEAGAVPDSGPTEGGKDKHHTVADAYQRLRYLPQQDRAVGCLPYRTVRQRPGVRSAGICHRGNTPPRHGTACLGGNSTMF